MLKNQSLLFIFYRDTANSISPTLEFYKCHFLEAVKQESLLKSDIWSFSSPESLVYKLKINSYLDTMNGKTKKILDNYIGVAIWHTWPLTMVSLTKSCQYHLYFYISDIYF